MGMARVTDSQKADTRRRLLASAASEFASAGSLAAANINRISENAGLAKGTVYNYFASKEALYLAVVTESAERAMSALPDLPPDTPISTAIEEILAADLAAIRDQPDLVTVHLRETLTTDSPFHTKAWAAMQPLVDRLTFHFGAAQERGDIPDALPHDALARLAIVFYAGLLVEQRAAEDGWPTDGAIPTLVAKACLGISR